MCWRTDLNSERCSGIELLTPYPKTSCYEKSCKFVVEKGHVMQHLCVILTEVVISLLLRCQAFMSACEKKGQNMSSLQCIPQEVFRFSSAFKKQPD